MGLPFDRLAEEFLKCRQAFLFRGGINMAKLHMYKLSMGGDDACAILQLSEVYTSQKLTNDEEQDTARKSGKYDQRLAALHIRTPPLFSLIWAHSAEI